jgi:hypothetical protein
MAPELSILWEPFFVVFFLLELWSTAMATTT